MSRNDESGSKAALDWPLPEVARITMTRERAYNTLTLELLESIAAHIGSALAEGARAIIVTGTGKVFCAGAHISYFTGAETPHLDSATVIREKYVRRIIEVFARLRDAPAVTIAAINGLALGGGCELALACDFRLMAEGARVGLTEARLGAVPAAGGVQLLAGIVGRSRALEMMVLADQWTASEARAIGLVNAVHAPDALPGAVEALAARVLACSPVSIAQTKQALSRGETLSPAEADAVALDAVTVAAAGPDWSEGMAAFKQKRAPAFARNGRPGEKPGLW